MLMDLFQCFENYLGRLRILTKIPSSVKGILVKIMVELLDVLALATRQIKQGRFSESVLTIVHSHRLNVSQKTSQRSCSGRMTWRPCCTGWTDSPWKSRA